MNNSINNVNPSFQANIVTRIQDRNGIMDKVSKRFAEKTKNYTGNLYILPAQNQSKTSALGFYINKNSNLFSGHLNELLGANIKNPSEVTNEVIDKITDRYVNIFRALKLDAAFSDTVKKFYSNLNDLKIAKQQHIEDFNNSVKEKNYTLAEMYRNLVDECDNKAINISEKIGMTAQRYYNLLNNVRKTEPTIKTWCDATQEALRNPSL